MKETLSSPGNSRTPIFYGWIIVATSFLILFAFNGVIINTFGVFFKPVSESMGWSRATFSVALGIGAIAMAVGSPFVGRMMDSFGANKTMLVGCLLNGIGMMWLGKATQLWHFYLLFAVVGLGLAATTAIPVSLLIANWFIRKRGKAMGLAFMGTSAGGMIMNPVNTHLLHELGWRNAYIVLGAGMLIFTTPLVLFLVKTRPSELKLVPDGEEHSADTGAVLTGHTLSEALRTSAFWFIAANMFLTTFMAQAIGVHCVPYLTDIGHSDMRAAWTYGISLGFMTLGKVVLGAIADRKGSRETFVLSAIMTAIGIGILMGASPFWAALLFAVVFGFPQGGPLTLTPMVAADCHGLANFGAIFGAASFFSILGAAVGPIVVGKMYDMSEPHTYQWAFVLLILMTLASAYCIHRARTEPGFATLERHS
ncbi:MAG: MFS transporter [Candidatus Abyssubacteria bacterium]